MREHDASLTEPLPVPPASVPPASVPASAPSSAPSSATLPGRDEKAAWVRTMFDTIAPRYDLVNTVMTLGLDRHWRRRTVASLALARGSTILDLACGTGALARVARRAGYRVVGVDLSAGMLARMQGSHVPAIQSDAAALPFPDATFDGVISAYALRNFVDVACCIDEAARVLRPGGRVAILEVATPPHRLLHAVHALWFRRIVPRMGAALSNARAYRYLPDSVVFLPDETHLRAILRAAGFSGVGRRLLQGGLSQLFSATREGVAGVPAESSPAR